MNPSDPAFPSLETFEKFDDTLGRYIEEHLPSGGLTKREWFAGLAMQGLLSHDCDHFSAKDLLEEGIAERAVKLSDALITELSKERKE